MDARMLENPGTLAADRRGSLSLNEPRRPLLNGSSRGRRSSGSLSNPWGWMQLRLGESDADRDGGDPSRPWFPDYEEVE